MQVDQHIGIVRPLHGTANEQYTLILNKNTESTTDAGAITTPHLDLDFQSLSLFIIVRFVRFWSLFPVFTIPDFTFAPALCFVFWVTFVALYIWSVILCLIYDYEFICWFGFSKKKRRKKKRFAYIHSFIIDTIFVPKAKAWTCYELVSFRTQWKKSNGNVLVQLS